MKGKQVESAGLVFSGENEDFTVNLSNVEDKGFEIIPRGLYNCIVSDLEFGYSQTSNNPMWTWTLEIEDGEYSGRKLFYYTAFSDKAMAMTKQVICRVTPELANESFNPSEVADSGKLIGNRCRAKLTISRYEGQQRNSVRTLLAAVNESSTGFLES